MRIANALGLSLAATLVGCASLDGADPLTCPLSVYSKNQGSGELLERVLGPEHIVSVEEDVDDVFGQARWIVRLTDEGGKINSQFSSNQIGKAIAILCGDEIISAPVVQAESSDSFLFTTGQERPN